jgi:hypothetical protein
MNEAEEASPVTAMSAPSAPSVSPPMTAAFAVFDTRRSTWKIWPHPSGVGGTVPPQSGSGVKPDSESADQ